MCCHHHREGCWRDYPEGRWIQFLILRTLYEKPNYGYQLIEEVERGSYGYHHLEPGTVYTLLRRMEERGLLESAWERTESGPDRRVYRLTELGIQELRRGLEMLTKRRALMDDLVDFYQREFEKGGESRDV